MDTKEQPQIEPADGFRDYRRAAHQLRLAANTHQSDERKRWIRAATRC